MKKFFHFFLFITCIVSAQSQHYFLLDKDTKLAVENANIDFNKGKGTHTDKQGAFLVPENIDFIKISFIGYELLELNIKTKSDTIFLTRSTETLNEVSI